MDKIELLKSYWGYSTFRNAQEKIIDNILQSNDVLCVMPTGAGKSVCYQLPALMLKGVTIVVSPLISLMIDQVKALVSMGIKAAYLNSNLTPQQQALAIKRAGQGAYKIIYVAPEKMLTSNFLSLCEKLDISMVAVDEAHCISQWGQDFRPDYLKIVDFIEKLKAKPVISAFTATATVEVKEDIKRILHLNNPFTVTTGFDRPNLSFKVLHPQNKNTQLLSLIRDKINECGIVYCNTRSAVEEVCSILCENKINAYPYHAGMPMEQRKANQEHFIYDRCNVIVATNAFGMGIDKSNVSYVIHYNMPKDMESYYQEAGRAGRDGNSAECIIMYSGKDVVTNKFLIERSAENENLEPDIAQIITEHKLRQLSKMSAYCNTADCLRGFILKYFGQPHSDYCGNCSNCNGDFEEIDITLQAQQILSCIAKTKQRFGVKMITDILRGSKNQKIISWGLNHQSTYGLLKTYTEADVKRMINYLIVNKFATQTQEQLPIIILNKNSIEVLKGNTKVLMRVQKGDKLNNTGNSKGKIPEYTNADINEEMYNYLKNVRNEIAQQSNVPSYIIFSNTSILDMCKKRPTTLSEFININGVGEQKMNSYGKIFTTAIGLFTEYESGFLTKEEITLTPQELKDYTLAYKTGCNVLHKVFGKGVVSQVSNGIVKIDFENGESKMLHTNFFGMKIIED
ncbi:MAG: DNA helicase RecQ [Acutalibacteraceae bacterium]